LQLEENLILKIFGKIEKPISNDVKGFQKFNLLKGSTNEEYTLYTSHSTWNSKSDFENWKKSEAFRRAHSGGGQHEGIYLGHPEFEGFEVVL